MDKNSIIEFVKQVASSRILTRDEVVQAYDQGSTLSTGGVPNMNMHVVSGKKMSFSGVLYFVGACIVLIGIMVLVTTNWEFLSSAVRILVTMGFAVVFFVAGCFLAGNDKTKTISNVLHILAAALFPTGIMVTLYEYQIYPTMALYASISGSLAALYAISLYFTRRNLFTVLFTIYATWFVYAFVTYLVVRSGAVTSIKDIYEYLTLALGACYVLVGNGLSSFKNHTRLSGVYYFVGSVGIYSALMSLSGWKPDQSLVFELIYILAVIGGMYLSVKWSARGLFLSSTFALFAFIIKMTAEYFSDALGWPFALIIAGGLMIAAGFLVANIRGRIKKTSTTEVGSADDLAKK